MFIRRLHVRLSKRCGSFQILILAAAYSCLQKYSPQIVLLCTTLVNRCLYRNFVTVGRNLPIFFFCCGYGSLSIQLTGIFRVLDRVMGHQLSTSVSSATTVFYLCRVRVSLIEDFAIFLVPFKAVYRVVSSIGVIGLSLQKISPLSCIRERPLSSLRAVCRLPLRREVFRVATGFGCFSL